VVDRAGVGHRLTRAEDAIELSSSGDMGLGLGGCGVQRVDVRAGDGDWRPASLEPAQGRAWQRFSVRWTPKERGTVVLASRRRPRMACAKPISGRRNAIHGVALNVI